MARAGDPSSALGRARRVRGSSERLARRGSAARRARRAPFASGPAPRAGSTALGSRAPARWEHLAGAVAATSRGNVFERFLAAGEAGERHDRVRLAYATKPQQPRQDDGAQKEHLASPDLLDGRGRRHCVCGLGSGRGHDPCSLGRSSVGGRRPRGSRFDAAVLDWVDAAIVVHPSSVGENRGWFAATYGEDGVVECAATDDTSERKATGLQQEGTFGCQKRRWNPAA